MLLDDGPAARHADDAPDDTRPDRLGVHVAWEALLAVAFAGALFWLYRSGSPLSTTEGRDAVIVALIPLLLLATAACVTFRAGNVNLAGGAFAAMAAVLFAENTRNGVAIALLIAVGVVLIAGVVLAALVVVLRTPGWLASAGIAAVILLWLHEHVTLAQLSTAPLGRLTTSSAWIWLIGVAALSIFAGVVSALNGPRHRFAACRRAAADGPRDRATVWTTAAVLVGSSVLAGFAGVWVMWTAADGAAVATGLDPATVTVFPVAAALLGGTSALGRRGGILGTLLASLLLATVMLLAATLAWPVSPLWILLVAVGAGLVVTRVVETLGGPRTTAPAPAAPVTEPGQAPLPMRQPLGDRDYDATDIDPYRRHDLDTPR
ncbi:ribose/xylose/arabinose/galactoside ABC-type transport system permease subunit [Stackebrandtia albiflava]|uniref:Ribose/xylose/arabinose/galactoside ABC-type transport system permease subunit n=2 Tax=Stackebrandtia albiflava TaxID=406432 RepID=A0A562UYN3_9ACTN|nr:ribose/xylose/arabinose/galactoside ABC-type transport system permease subunit [Stackebrandtia albiflava]